MEKKFIILALVFGGITAGLIWWYLQQAEAKEAEVNINDIRDWVVS